MKYTNSGIMVTTKNNKTSAKAGKTQARLEGKSEQI
jgi:hypothetical protein